MAVSDSQINPRFDITLTDQSSNTLNLILSNPLALARTLYPTGSVQIQEGRGTHSDKIPPYAEEQQSNWSGGRGAKRLSSDRTKYYEGTADSRTSEQLTLPGQETFTTEYVCKHQNMPGAVTWVTLTGSSTYLAESFTVGGSNVNIKDILVIIREKGTATSTLTCKLYNNSANEPTTARAGATATLLPGSHERGDDYSVYHVFSLSSEDTLTASTEYHLVLYADGGSDDADNHWEVATIITGGDGNTSSDGSSWSTSTNHICYAMTPDQNDARTYFFEYRRALYAVKNVAGSNSALWLNGDRGVADSNSGDLTNLEDASKSWTTNEWANTFVLIIRGPGSEERQPWRQVLSNDANSLVCDRDWEITHTTSTEYVILGSDTWQEVVADLGAVVTSAPVEAADRMYIPFGDTQNIKTIYQGTDGAGAFTTLNFASNVKSGVLLPLDNEGQPQLWGTSSRGLSTSQVWYADLLPYPDYVVTNVFELLTNKGQIAPTDIPWQGRFYANVLQQTNNGDTTVTIAAGFTTGVASHYDLPQAVDASKGDRLLALVQSTVATSAGDLEVLFSSRPALGQDYFLPSSVVWQHADVHEEPDNLYHWQDRRRPQKVLFYDDSGTDPNDWRDYQNLPIGKSDTDTPEFTQQLIAWQANDRLYFGSPVKWGRFWFDIDGAQTQGRTASYKAWIGDSWAAQTVTTDSTISAGAPFGANSDEADVVFNVTTQTYNDWQKGGIPTDNSTDQLDTDLYWIELSFNGTADAFRIRNMWLDTLHDNERHFATMSEALDQDEDTHFDLTFGADDYILIGHSKPFGKAAWLFNDAEVLGDSVTLSGEYTNGEKWAALTGFTDGTGGAASGFGGDGDMTWDIPSDWQSITINGADKYWVRIKSDIKSTEKHIPVQSVAVGAFPGEQQHYTSLEAAKDGDTATEVQVALLTTNSILIGASEIFNKAHINVGTSVNNNAATLTASYWNDSTFSAIDASDLTDGTASAGAPFAIDGDVEITVMPEDWTQATINGVEAYWLKLTTSANLDGVDILEVRCKNDMTFAISCPALAANVWKIGSATIRAENERRLLKAVRSVGINVVVDNGAQTVYLHGGLQLVNEGVTYIPVGDLDEPINNLVAYNDGQDVATVWAHKPNRPYYLDRANNIFKPFNLGEVESLRSSANGIAVTVNDVHMYFNLGRTLQRYLTGSLQSVGPELGEGLPGDQQGDYVQALSYAGQVFLVVDAGASGYSSVLSLSGGGWHNLYRAPKGLRIYNAAIQAVDGAGIDRLWINVGDHLIYVPLPKGSFDPTKDSDYPFRHEGYLTTAWIDLDWPEIKKMFRQLRVVTENLTSNIKISFDYRLDGGGGTVQEELSDTWTVPNSNVFTTSPQDSELFDGSDGKPDTKGYRLQLRFKLETNDKTVSPVMYAYVVEALMKQGVKFAYNGEVKIEDELSDLTDVPDWSVVAETADTQLKTWVDDVEVLTLNSSYSLYDGELVMLHSYESQPRELDRQGDKGPKEYHLGRIAILGV